MILMLITESNESIIALEFNDCEEDRCIEYDGISPSELLKDLRHDGDH